MSDTPATPGNAGSPEDDHAEELKKRRLSRQDKIIQAYITDSEVFLGVAAKDPEIRPRLEARGYDDAEFASGLTLVANARKAFEDRAGAMGHQASGTDAALTASQAARHEYARFRSIARACFPDKADRLGLSLTGDVPEDASRFITTATASYTAGQKAPYTVKLAKRGFTHAALETHIEALKTFTAAIAGRDEAEGDAIADTASRDSAYDALRGYMKELKGVAKGELRGKSALLTKLGLH